VAIKAHRRSRIGKILVQKVCDLTAHPTTAAT
jgi:hypothetical protein